MKMRVTQYDLIPILEHKQTLALDARVFSSQGGKGGGANPFDTIIILLIYSTLHYILRLHGEAESSCVMR